MNLTPEQVHYGCLREPRTMPLVSGGNAKCGVTLSLVAPLRLVRQPVVNAEDACYALTLAVYDGKGNVKRTGRASYSLTENDALQKAVAHYNHWMALYY